MLAGAILSEVVATLSLRASEGFSRGGPTALMAVGYVVSFVLLAQALKRGMGIGVAYAVWAGVGVALVAILGRVLFNEPLRRDRGGHCAHHRRRGDRRELDGDALTAERPSVATDATGARR